MARNRLRTILEPLEAGQSALELALWACGAAAVLAVAGYVVLWSRDGDDAQALSLVEQAYVNAIATQQAEAFIRAVATQPGESYLPQPQAQNVNSALADPPAVSSPRDQGSTAAPARTAVPPSPILPPPPLLPTSTPVPAPTLVPFDARYLDHIQCDQTVYSCTGNARGIDVAFGCQEYAPGQLSCQGETEYGEYVEFYCEPDPNWYGQEYERWFCS